MAQKNQTKQPQEPDIADDPSFFWRYLKMLVEQIATALGEHGLEVAWVVKILATLEAVLGPVLVSQGMNVLGAVVQHPEVLKKAIRGLGLPEQVNGLIEEGIDDIAGGLRNGYLERNRLTGKEATVALHAATGKLRVKLQAIATYAEAKALLPVDEQDAIDDVVRGLRTMKMADYDGEKTWAHYRGLLTKPSLLRALARHRDEHSLETLEWLRGEFGPLPPAAKSVQKIKDSLGRAGEAVVGLVAGEIADFAKDPRKALIQPATEHMAYALLQEKAAEVRERQARDAWRAQAPSRLPAILVFVAMILLFLSLLFGGEAWWWRLLGGIAILLIGFLAWRRRNRRTIRVANP